MALNCLKSKKGLLIEGTAIVIVFLLSTAMVYLLWDNTESHEELKIGQMLLDVYRVEEKVEEFEYFFVKSGEYSLLNGLKNNINVGLLDGTKCSVLYDLEKGEECYIENLIDVFGENVAEKTSEHFIEEFDNSVYGLNFKKVRFKTQKVNKELILNIKSDEKIDFGRDAERKMVYNVSIDFNTKLEFAFDEYLKMITPLKNNLACLESLSDINSEGSAVSNCLNAYPEFSNLKKEGGILSFDYTVKGVLFEKKLTGPFRLDIEGFRRATMASIA